MENINLDALTVYHNRWALLAAGAPDDYNAMTISWGGMGTLWGKPSVTVYVKPIRHTWNYMEKSDYFTVSFYPEEYRKDLAVMGSLSGRDGDKTAKTSLTVKPAGETVTFEQAEVTLVCRKRYWNDLVVDNMPAEEVARYYTTEAPHRMYIGEVVEIIRR